jgi:uncharacterized protein YktA (UPF0223 family)
MGGFSNERLRFYILGFMSLGLIMAPFLGLIASFIVVLIFGIFTAVKINEFQQNNPESILLHRQAMDRMYHNSVNAKYFEEMLRPYKNKVVFGKNPVKIKAIQYQKQTSHASYQRLVYGK